MDVYRLAALPMRLALHVWDPVFSKRRAASLFSFCAGWILAAGGPRVMPLDTGGVGERSG
jgi:hypothetical protein